MNQAKQEFSYDFKQELVQLDKTPLQKRIHPQGNKYSLDAQFERRVQPEQLIGDITRIEQILNKGADYVDKVLVVAGWVKTARLQQNNTLLFINLNDGTNVQGIQIVIENKLPNFSDLMKLQTGCSLKVKGKIVKSPGQGQDVEMLVNEPAEHYSSILGLCDNKTYALAKKHHTLEHLREQAHFRPRSYLIGAVTRIRNSLAYSTNTFFYNNGFQYIHTPIITSSDCEGAGEMFAVTSLVSNDTTLDKIPVVKGTNKVDFSQDFFKQFALLTCSGQLNVEVLSFVNNRLTAWQ